MADDVTLIAPRGSWKAVEGLRPGTMRCEPLCERGFWGWMRGLRAHCLMKAHLAAWGAHHVELQGALCPNPLSPTTSPLASPYYAAPITARSYLSHLA